MRPTRLLALCLLTILIFSACVPGSPPPAATLPVATVPGASSPAPGTTPTPTPSPTPTALPTLGVDPSALRGTTIQVWHAFNGPAYDLLTSQAAQFTAQNAWGILVHPAGYGDYASLFDIVNTALETAQSPDLVAALPEQTLAWQSLGVVVPLDDYLGDPQWALVDGEAADIPPVFWAQDNVDGKQLGLPAQRSTRLLYYNVTWAHELGYSSPPATAEEFRRQACAANASFRADADPNNDGYGGWIVDADWQTSYAWLLAFGGGVADGNAYGFRTDPNLATLQFEKDLFDSHCAWLSTEPTPFDSFARRSALFISADLSGLSAEAESMRQMNNADEWTVIPFPGPQGRVIVTYGPSYSILKTTPERQLAAWLFARWLLSPENQSLWVEATGLFPLRTSMLNTIQPFRQSLPQWDAAVDALDQAQNVPQLASWRKVRYVLEDGMTVLFQTNLPVDRLPAVLEGMDTLAQEISKQ